ncbi:MAG: sugar phosphate isomerase/epimerase [Clostridiales bacterium]|nr:sugar phosphate isomerase/epimerase [Clostridiales bacterium]
MNLGIISWIGEEDFKKVKERGLSFVELDVNDRAEEFLANLESTKEYSKKYELPVGAVGRWGSDRICKDGICEEELSLEYKLIDATAALDCDVYITGCNYVEELSYYENVRFAIAYFEKLIAYGKEKGVKIATYNCRWNNFVCTPMAYQLIHGYLKDLYIKYDTSHCIYAGGDYLQETRDWAHRFAHVHLKGALIVDGERYDDPPAGLDQTNWGAFLAILYSRGYDGNLSIEPHSANWKGELGERGVDYTVRYFRNLIL